MAKQAKTLCSMKVAAGLVGALMGSPLDLEPTDNCTCSACAAIRATRAAHAQLPGIGPGMFSQRGMQTVLSQVANLRPEPKRVPGTPIKELRRQPDGTYTDEEL